MMCQQASTCQADLLNQSACSPRNASLVDKLEYYTQPPTLSNYKHLICNYEIWNELLQMHIAEMVFECQRLVIQWSVSQLASTQ